MATATTEVADEQVSDPKLNRSKLTEMDANPNYVRGPGAVPKDRERKIGHRRVDEKTGTVTYKKKPTSELMAAIQLGIGQSVGGLSSKPERDLLMQDFGVVQSVFFPSEGSNITPAHHLSDYKFKTYAALAFRYFRELFNIRPDDFMLSLCDDAMVELSNPGAGGSIFYISSDDEFIIKTAQHKEAGFLQKLLPGYYMNLNQNPRTLLPKFYGLYCYQCGGKNIRFVVMNNILPSTVKIHEKYDLKGSTYKRKASKSERAKSSPTWKDLDFMGKNPEGLLLEKETYDALIKTLQRDCRVLESFKIMDYSLLMGVHNLDQAKRDAALAENKSSQSNDTAGTSSGGVPVPGSTGVEPADGLDGRLRSWRAQRLSMWKAIRLSRGKSVRTKVTQFNTPMESIQAEVNNTAEFDDEDIPPGGIPAKNGKGERLLLYLGVIDILQCYRMRKKMEHTFKSMIADADTVSVTRPSFYAERFLRFFTSNVFKKAPSPLKHSPSKKKPGEQIPGTMGGRPDLLIGSTTPPPPFSEVAGAKPRGNSTPSPRGSVNTDSDRSEGKGHFQTIQQQEDSSLRNSLRGIPHRHSPLSVSESTPTYTDFTEGTPSYTASSPSCCSDVLDSTVPNLPLEKDCEGPSLENSPSKATAIGSSTDTSYYSTVSHVESAGDAHGDAGTHNSDSGGGVTTVSVTSRSEERFSSNSQSVTVTSRREASHEVRQNGQSTGQSGNIGGGSQVRVGGERVTIVLPSPDSDTNLSGGEPRISVTSQQSANTSFSTQTGSVDSQYSESIVSSSTERSRATSRSDSTDGSWSNAEMNKTLFNVTEKETHDITEVVHEVDESTHL